METAPSGTNTARSFSVLWLKAGLGWSGNELFYLLICKLSQLTELHRNGNLLERHQPDWRVEHQCRPFVTPGLAPARRSHHCFGGSAGGVSGFSGGAGAFSSSSDGTNAFSFQEPS